MLTYGFIKSFFKEPLEDIVNIILQFYDDMRYWTISSGKPMDRFRECPPSKVLDGPKSVIQNIEFQLMVAPNGFDSKHQGKVVLILSVSKLPVAVKYVYVYFILFCLENKYQHKVTRILVDHVAFGRDNTGVHANHWRGQVAEATGANVFFIKDGKIHVQAGGGVVADSDPETEYQESFHKARALMRVRAAPTRPRFRPRWRRHPPPHVPQRRAAPAHRTGSAAPDCADRDQC